MVIVMAPGAGEAGLAAVVTRIEAHGGQAFVSRGVMRTIVGVVGSEDVLEALDVAGLPGRGRAARRGRDDAHHRAVRVLSQLQELAQIFGALALPAGPVGVSQRGRGTHAARRSCRLYPMSVCSAILNFS